MNGCADMMGNTCWQVGGSLRSDTLWLEADIVKWKDNTKSVSDISPVTCAFLYSAKICGASWVGTCVLESVTLGS